jgi:hypothetical protein
MSTVLRAACSALKRLLAIALEDKLADSNLLEELCADWSSRARVHVQDD